VVAFWLLTRLIPPNQGEGFGGLPYFFNPVPVDVRQLASRAMKSVASGDPNAESSKALLARLGGAALPYVLPELDTLPPRGRAQVALALGPIAERMRIGSHDELSNPEAAILFWHRFWQDRALDFRPTVVRRLVRRLAARDLALRRDDLVELDTYALPELVQAMGRVRGTADVERVARLTSLAAYVSGLNWRVSEQANVGDARRTVARWLDWWAAHHANFTAFDGMARLTATLTETQFGKWAAEVTRDPLGVTSNGELVLDVMRERTPVTGWLLVAALLAGYIGGLLLGASLKGKAELFVQASAFILIGVPIAVLGLWLKSPAHPESLWRGALVLAAVWTAWTFCHTKPWSAHNAVGEPPKPGPRTGGLLSRYSNALRAGRGPISALGPDLPLLLSAAFTLEAVLGLRGLGWETLQAVSRGDRSWLMAMALTCATLTGLFQIASDTLLDAQDDHSSVHSLRTPRRPKSR
jgi:hypothetical protein